METTAIEPVKLSCGCIRQGGFTAPCGEHGIPSYFMGSTMFIGMNLAVTETRKIDTAPWCSSIDLPDSCETFT